MSTLFPSPIKTMRLQAGGVACRAASSRWLAAAVLLSRLPFGLLAGLSLLPTAHAIEPIKQPILGPIKRYPGRPRACHLRDAALDWMPDASSLADVGATLGSNGRPKTVRVTQTVRLPVYRPRPDDGDPEILAEMTHRFRPLGTPAGSVSDNGVNGADGFANWSAAGFEWAGADFHAIIGGEKLGFVQPAKRRGSGKAGVEVHVAKPPRRQEQPTEGITEAVTAPKARRQRLSSKKRERQPRKRSDRVPNRSELLSVARDAASQAEKMAAVNNGAGSSDFDSLDIWVHRLETEGGVPIDARVGFRWYSSGYDSSRGGTWHQVGSPTLYSRGQRLGY